MQYTIEAISKSKPDDILIRDRLGRVHLYVGSVNRASKRPLPQDLIDSLLASGSWELRDDSRWLGLEDLQIVAAEDSERSNAWRWLQEHLREVTSRKRELS